MPRCSKPNISVGLFILVVLFNISSWIDHDGLWAELPLLVQHLPEYWALPSYLTIATELASIGPLFFFVANSVKPGAIKETPTIYAVITVGFLSCVIQIFVWSKTTLIAGGEHSVAFLVLAFIAAFTDATSSVVFLAYMAHLPPAYMSAFYVGDGLCGLVPSIVALIQGAGEYDCLPMDTNGTLDNASSISEYNNTFKQVLREPLFSVEVYFVLLSLIMATSGIGFTLLNYLPWSKQFHVKRRGTVTHQVTAESASLNQEVGPDIRVGTKGKSCCNYLDQNEQSNLFLPSGNNIEIKTISIEEENATGKTPYSMRVFVFLLIQYGFQLGVRYGVLYPVQAFALLPYGPLAFSLGNRLTTVALPLSCFAALFFPTRSLPVITAYSLVGTAAAAYIVVLASLSPDPPLKETTIGTALAVSAWPIMSASWGYCKVGIALIMRDFGKKQLMWTGGAHVLCTTIFASIMFVLISTVHVFEEDTPC